MIMAAAGAGGIMANSSNQKIFSSKHRNTKYIVKISIKRVKEQFLGIMYIPQIFKNPNKGGKSPYWKIRKSKSMLCDHKIAGIKLSEALFEDISWILFV